MFNSGLIFFQNVADPSDHASGDNNIHQYNVALNKFRSTLRQGNLFRLKRKVLKHPSRLYDLNTLKPSLHLRGGSYAGVQVVPIRAIIGSEGTVADFDMEFHPLNEKARERWVGLAMAYLSGFPLPPVELIQVGDVYFVRDGHHRISVSRFFGQIA